MIGVYRSAHKCLFVQVKSDWIQSKGYFGCK